MDILGADYITEQNKIASSGAWIWLLEITTLGQTTLRFANNSSDVVWPSVGGDTYTRSSLLMDDLNITTSGEFPTYKLQVGEVGLTGALRTQIKATAGLVGSIVRLRIVHSDHLDLTTPAIDEASEILSCELTASAVIFTVGIPSLLSKRLPRDRYVPGFCRHRFAGALCNYAQPSFSLTSSSISFVPGVDQSTPDERYNAIWVPDGGLLAAVFNNAPGAAQGSKRALDDDTVFSILGSASNDGWFIANNFHAVADTYVRVFVEDDGGRAFVDEDAGADITIQLGYSDCDKTLEACQLRDNTQNYGGSPGIVGGVYG